MIRRRIVVSVVCIIIARRVSTTGYHRRSPATDDPCLARSDNKRMGAESATGIDGAEADAVADEFDDFAPRRR